MDFQKYKIDIIVISSTIVFNCILNITVGLLAGDIMIITGLLVSPIVGGAVRTSICKKRHLIYIIPGMVALDIIVFIPLIMIIVGWGGIGSYVSGMIIGAGSAAVMVITSLITLGIRLIINKVRKNNLGEEMPSPKVEYQQDTDTIIKSSDINKCPSCYKELDPSENWNCCRYCGKELYL